MSKKKDDRSAAEQPVPDGAVSAAAASEGGRRSGSAKKGAKGTPSKGRERAPDEPRKGISGVPGSLNDSRRCSATANRTGERCRAPAIRGGTVCRMHGGALPQVKAKAKERLLALVDPALVALHKILTDEDVDDAHRVRAALGVLDRTGFGPGSKVEVGVSRFDDLVAGALGGEKPTLESTHLDRELAPTTSEDSSGPIGWEDAHQHGVDAQIESWREYDAEDENPWHTRLNPYDSNTVQGEVVVMSDSLLPDRSKDPAGATEMSGGVRPADKRATDAPPRYAD